MTKAVLKAAGRLMVEVANTMLPPPHPLIRKGSDTAVEILNKFFFSSKAGRKVYTTEDEVEDAEDEEKELMMLEKDESKSEEPIVKTSPFESVGSDVKVQEGEGKEEEIRPLESVLSWSSSDVVSWLSTSSCSSSEQGEETANVEALISSNGGEIQGAEADALAGAEAGAETSELEMYLKKQIISRSGEEELLTSGEALKLCVSEPLLETSLESDISPGALELVLPAEQAELTVEKQRAELLEVKVAEEADLGTGATKAEGIGEGVAFGHSSEALAPLVELPIPQLNLLGGERISAQPTELSVEMVHAAVGAATPILTKVGGMKQMVAGSPGKDTQKQQRNKQHPKWVGTGGRIKHKYQGVYDPRDKHEANYWHQQTLNWQKSSEKPRHVRQAGRPEWKN